jgi:poly(3-hydroxybutyrate) depolymerase
VLAGLVAGLSCFVGCAGGGNKGNPFGATGTGGSKTTGTGGSTQTTGTGGSTQTTGTGGSTQTTGTGGTTDTGGSTGTAGTTDTGIGGTTGTAGATADGGAAGDNSGGGGSAGGTTGTGGVGTMGPFGDITKVAPTTGCGQDPGFAANTTTRFTIMTTGTKATDCADHTANCAPGPTCGPTAWSYTREYFVTLPTGYDKTKAYPLVFEGPGCGSNGQAVYPLTYMGANNVNNTVIRVGLTPPPNTIGHATNPCQGCFDDKEGDDSVDWVFYENTWDHLASTLCFDKNRVFSAGNSSGAWFSNEVGCKYAGDSKHPIRAVLPNTGGLPSQPMYEPTCTNAPLAGMWIGETQDPENAFSNNVFAISRAAGVNHCTPSTFVTTSLPADPNFPIGGGNADTVCKMVSGCPTLYPLVVCLIPGMQHQGHDNVANPGFGTFISMFEKAPFLTQ